MKSVANVLILFSSAWLIACDQAGQGRQPAEMGDAMPAEIAPAVELDEKLKPVTVAGDDEVSALWQADLGNGFYKNPVLYADYSDPDVVKVGEDYYMTASSFNASPGLPVLHSKDLVNWELIGYALDKIVPVDHFSTPQHGNGVWAPNIRYHDGRIWIFYPDPDFGIYMIQTTDPREGWSEPVLVLPGKGIIDPTPLWDDDGQAYLLHAWAKSRSGINNILTLHKMSPDGTKVLDEGKVIIDGNELPGYRTVEGPKFYKRNGYYYVFAPAGGVPVGWQSVFRAKTIYGPYEDRIVMEQGDTLTNGPHQGAWVTTESGEDWFFHFQSKLAYGRIVHLQPMRWVDDWPVIGVDDDGDGVGNPVKMYRKPDVGADINKGWPVKNLPMSDDFDGDTLALQWQWNANYSNDWYALNKRSGYLRLYAQPKPDAASNNMWMMPSLLLQKIPAPHFIAETTFELPATLGNATAGLLMFGEDYAWIGFEFDKETGEAKIGYASCHDARKGCEESFNPEDVIKGRIITLRMTMMDGGGTVFSYLNENGRFKALGELFQARRGRWVGAKVGLFARVATAAEVNQDNFIDIDGIKFYQPQWPANKPARGIKVNP